MMDHRIPPTPKHAALTASHKRSAVIAGLTAVVLMVGVQAADTGYHYATTSPAIVHSIRDGDGPRLVIDGKVTTCRMEGIDAPELDQPGGIEAKDALSRWLIGNKVRYSTNGPDMYGRPIITLFVAGKSINVQLVERGYAMWYRSYSPRRTDLAVAQERAMASKQGIWGAKSPPVPPWRWRREQRQQHVDEPQTHSPAGLETSDE